MGRSTCDKPLNFYRRILDKFFAKSAWQLGRLVKLECCSQIVYRGGEHWIGTFLRIYDHPDYPFLLTMSNATTWEILSRETTRGPMTLGFLYTICLVGLLFSLVYALRGFPQAALAAIVLSSQAVVAYHGMAQYADMPESFLFSSLPWAASDLYVK